MSATYQAVTWNAHKRRYDSFLVNGIVLYLAVFMGVGLTLFGGDHALSPEVLLIRALGSGAIILLHVILCIGPLARLSKLWQPLLYNRRHLGVAMFILALLHGGLSLVYYHGFGVVNPLASLFTIYPENIGLRSFPFQILGFFALVILFLLAATSHDFWLNQLGATAWKWLHMLAYVAYGLLLAHVMLGVWQADRAPFLTLPLIVGFVLVASLHLVTGLREWGRIKPAPVTDNWLDAGPVTSIPVGRAVCVVALNGQRVAVFRSGDQVHAFDDRCAHQGGPLNEGKLIDGCVTCPWHGWQYQLADGASPPPYLEKVGKHAVRIHEGHVWVAIAAEKPGTPLVGVLVEDPA